MAASFLPVLYLPAGQTIRTAGTLFYTRDVANQNAGSFEGILPVEEINVLLKNYLFLI